MKRRPATAALAALALVACKSLEEGARETFSRDFSCPEARVVVVPRTDLNAYDVTFGSVGNTAPPADVQKDPERLALWRRQKRDQRDAWNGRISVFEARGCEHDAIYTCSHPNGRKGGENYAQASCSKATTQPGVQKK
jgi:hypothetical protein